MLVMVLQLPRRVALVLVVVVVATPGVVCQGRLERPVLLQQQGQPGQTVLLQQ